MSHAEMKTLLLEELVGPGADAQHRYVEPREAASMTARDCELQHALRQILEKFAVYLKN